jgi:hypothetical protein
MLPHYDRLGGISKHACHYLRESMHCNGMHLLLRKHDAINVRLPAI